MKYWPADDIKLLRDSLQKCEVALRKLAELYDPEEEDTEDVCHVPTNGDCRRSWEALSCARIALEETLGYNENK